MRNSIFSTTPTCLSSFFKGFRVSFVLRGAPWVSFFTTPTMHHQMVVLAAGVWTSPDIFNRVRLAASIEFERYSTMRVSPSHAHRS